MIKLLLITCFIFSTYSCKKEGIAQILPKSPKFPKAPTNYSAPERLEGLRMKWTKGMDSILKRVGEEARDN